MDEVGEVPTVCFDYCFLRDHPGGESVLVMVSQKKRLKMMLVHVVPFKGGGVDGLVGQLLRDPRKSNSQERPRERHLGCAQRCLPTEGKRERLSSDPCRVNSKGRISVEWHCRASSARFEE